MSKLGPALSFYLKHGADVTSLVELESRPEGVREGDWTKFCRVVALANEEACELVLACRNAIVAGLGDAILPLGNGASRKRVFETWDAWREFKPMGTVKKSMFGWIGASLYVLGDDGGWLVGYVRPKSTNASPREALRAMSPVGDQLAMFTPETAIVFQIHVTAETDREQAARACGEKFAMVREALKAYSADTTSGAR